MYILTSQSSACAKPYLIQKSRKPAFVDAVTEWLEKVEIEGDSATEILNGVDTVTNNSDEIITLEIDGLSIEIYHEYPNS
jgi:thioredoxin reductase